VNNEINPTEIGVTLKNIRRDLNTIILFTAIEGENNNLKSIMVIMNHYA